MGWNLWRSAATSLILTAAVGASASASEPLARFVVLGDDGAPIARVVTDEAACPALLADGVPIPMTVRAGPATIPQRPTASKPELSKPSAFPVTVCEAAIPRRTRRASIAGVRLPLPKPRADRILVIGDTGCRLKAADAAYQACRDAAAYPFATIARLGAAWRPDLIVHVGDYEYRENPCPAGNAGCADSPWGYGWDAWNADFFAPGAPLLAAAPLVLARGNHENCVRAGQGWFRFLDPHPLVAGRDCNDPASDFAADDTAPYAVPLGGGDQIVVMDLAIAGNKPLAADDPRMAQFRADWRRLRDLAAKADSTFMLTHKPTLGFGALDAGGKTTLFGGPGSTQSAFLAEDPGLFPKGVDVLLSGHVHLWEQVSFSTPHPTQFIAGFSGTQEETVPLPEHLPPGATPGAGAIPDAFSSWIEGFGYMTLEREGPRRWRVKVWNVKGEVANRCRIVGRKSWCDKARVG